MTRADDILELIESHDQDLRYEDNWRNSLLDWMGNREDQEIIEIMRGAAATLAFRSVQHEDQPSLHPTTEVFMTALKEVAKSFNKHAQEATD